jgi:hypothetical protein
MGWRLLPPPLSPAFAYASTYETPTVHMEKLGNTYPYVHLDRLIAYVSSNNQFVYSYTEADWEGTLRMGADVGL